MRVVVLAGGFGGARMAHGLALVGDEVALTVVGNVADDLEVHGLHVSPDLDTVMYTLAGLANPETGWGVVDETWSASQMLERYGEPTWFRLGDRDLATHIARTARLHAGERLTTVTEALARSLGVPARLLPSTDDRVRTSIRIADGWLDFQTYFVRRRHADEVLEVRFEGIEAAAVTPEATTSIEQADVVVLAPSNPVVSLAPILGVSGMTEVLSRSGAAVVGISPIVGGAALRGPAADMLRGAGYEASAGGIARFYAERYPGLLHGLLIDDVDAALADDVRRAGIEPHVVPAVMPDEPSRRAVARQVLALAARLGGRAAQERRA